MVLSYSCKSVYRFSAETFFLKIFYTSDSNSDKNPEMGHATHNIWQNSSNQENPEKSLLNKELEYKINNALKKLPAKQKVVFELKILSRSTVL